MTDAAAVSDRVVDLVGELVVYAEIRDRLHDLLNEVRAGVPGWGAPGRDTLAQGMYELALAKIEDPCVGPPIMSNISPIVTVIECVLRRLTRQWTAWGADRRCPRCARRDGRLCRAEAGVAVAGAEGEANGALDAHEAVREVEEDAGEESKELALGIGVHARRGPGRRAGGDDDSLARSRAGAEEVKGGEPGPGEPVADTTLLLSALPPKALQAAANAFRQCARPGPAQPRLAVTCRTLAPPPPAPRPGAAHPAGQLGAQDRGRTRVPGRAGRGVEGGMKPVVLQDRCAAWEKWLRAGGGGGGGGGTPGRAGCSFCDPRGSARRVFARKNTNSTQGARGAGLLHAIGAQQVAHALHDVVLGRVVRFVLARDLQDGGQRLIVSLQQVTDLRCDILVD